MTADRRGFQSPTSPDSMALFYTLCLHPLDFRHLRPQSKPVSPKPWPIAPVQDLPWFAVEFMQCHFRRTRKCYGNILVDDRPLVTLGLPRCSLQCHLVCGGVQQQACRRASSKWHLLSDATALHCTALHCLQTLHRSALHNGLK